MIDFPTGATVGQIITLNARSWKWNGVGWERVSNQGQVASIFITLAFVQEYAGKFNEGPQLPATTFTLVNYV